MALYSPPNRSYPQEIPNYWRFEDGTVRTDLQTLTDAELEALGWHGPITMPDDIPNTSQRTHSYTWNSNTLSFDVKELDKDMIDYGYFWRLLVNGVDVGDLDDPDLVAISNFDGGHPHMGGTDAIAYKKIKEIAKTSLEVNVLVTEFISLIFDARLGNIDAKNIQKTISEIMNLVSFNEAELLELRKIFSVTNMDIKYTLG